VTICLHTCACMLACILNPEHKLRLASLLKSCTANQRVAVGCLFVVLMMCPVYLCRLVTNREQQAVSHPAWAPTQLSPRAVAHPWQSHSRLPCSGTVRLTG
jgi:hypothetical protein